MMLINRRDPDPQWWLRSVPEAKNATWSDVNVLRFLRLYEAHPGLWNVHSPLYKNVCWRLKSYNHVVEQLNLRDVNVKECMKLVDWLKKEYLEEKDVRRPKCERRPAWFEIIRRIVKAILNPEETDCCVECCTQCCGCETPPSSTVSSDFQDCKDCCAGQSLCAPCKYYKRSGSDTSFESNRCNFEKVECYTLLNDELKVVLYKIGDGVKRNLDCDCSTEGSSSKNSDCDCKTDDGSSKKSSDKCLCCCKSESSTSSSSSSDKDCSCQKSSTVNSIPSVSTVEQFCIKPMPPVNESSSGGTSSGASTTIVDDKIRGIFKDSRRFRGKRISLLDDYVCNDGCELELMPPRFHWARCLCDSDFYPLQVEL